MIFDYYDRPYKVDIANTRRISTTCYYNGFRYHNGGLALFKTSERIPTGKMSGTVFILTKPVPEPFSISGTPSPIVAGNGSYDFTPTVAGGVGPYVFELTGTLEDGFAFDTSNGHLSRPPQ